MFTSLKKKIKEEDGEDVGKLTALVNAATPKFRSGHSRQGSASTLSLSSFTIDGSKEDAVEPVLDLKLADGKAITPKEFKRLESKEDEWRKKLNKKDEEYAVQLKKIEESWKKKLDILEKEMKKELERKDGENRILYSERKNLLATVAKLEERVQQSEEYKTKLCQYQDDFDQLEGFQTQEMAKIKHLLLQEEQRVSEKEQTIEKQSKTIADLNAEIRRLSEAERKLSDVVDRLEEERHSTEQEKAMLTSRLATETEALRHLKDRVAVLEERNKASCMALGAELTTDDRVQGLLGERMLLERLLAEAHEHLSEVKTTWSGKITSLETQVGRLCRQAIEESTERRQAEQQRDSLLSRLQIAEVQASSAEEKLTAVEEEKRRLAEEVKVVNEKLEKFAREMEESLSIANKSALTTQTELEEKLNRFESLESGNARLSSELAEEKSERQRVEGLLRELKAEYESEKHYGEQIKLDIGREIREKDDLMMRNAQVSQEVELVRKELRSIQQENNEMHSKLEEMHDIVVKRDEELKNEKTERESLNKRLLDFESLKNKETEVEEVKSRNNVLEDQLLEKNKTIKVLQQRLSDIKKAMQRELKVPSRSIDPGGMNGEGIIPAHGPALLTPCSSDDSPDDVNFKYLKHVLFKFLTCREYEAQHLTRAVATLLRFTAEEERLLRETMDWKASWFGSKPKRNGSFHSQSPS